MVDIDKIIRTLDLTQSDAREETLVGIIKFIIYNANVDIAINDIPRLIKNDFSIEVHNLEVEEAIFKLIDLNLVEKDGEKIKLSQDESLKIKGQTLKNEEEKKVRFNNFCTHINQIAFDKEYDITDAEIKGLWELFLNYLHETYLSYGKNAILNFTSQESSDVDEVNFLIKKYLKEINNNNLEKIFIEYVKKFPTYVDSQLLSHLTELANKTEAFYALGLSRDEYDRIYQDIKFDWIVFVDTNFLYSILNLHSHPEDEAARAVLKLGNELGIKFKYIPKTYDELNNKRKDFDNYLERNLEINQVRALLKSNKLDNFARNYYEKKISDPTNTPHPTDIINHSQNILNSNSLQIYQSKFEAMDSLKDYLLDQESSYSDYLSMLDENRVDKGLKAKGKKDPYQVAHDIFLRESILFLRKKNVTSLSETKYFGVTLDKTLIKYDHFQTLKKSYSKVIPTFFKPSHLLKKLLKYSPINTEDYLRAFIKTISTPALDDNFSTSRTAIRSVKYFHKMGINNERLIFDCLKEEMFLSNFENKENDANALGEFIESEINKKIVETSEEIDKLKNIQKEKDSELSKIKNVSLLTNKENIKLEKKIDEIESSLKLYQKELKKVVNKTNQGSLDSAQNQLTIEHEAENIFVEERYKEIELRNKRLVDKVLSSKRMYYKIKGVILILSGLIILFGILLIFIFQDSDWNFVAYSFNKCEDLSGMRKDLIVFFTTILIGFLDFLIFKKVKEIFFDKKLSERLEKEIIDEI